MTKIKYAGPDRRAPLEKYDGKERRTISPWNPADTGSMSEEAWRKTVVDKFILVDEGHTTIILRLDQQDYAIERGNNVAEKVLEETREVRKLVGGARWGGRVIAAFGQGVHIIAKWVAPILAAVAAAWGLIWAYLHDWKP